MKNFYVLPFISLFCFAVMAQTKLDTMLVNVDQTTVTSGIIYERVTQFANLYNFNQPNYPNTADYKYLRQGLSELYRASKQTRLISLKTLDNRIAATTNTNEADVAIINTPFEILNYNYENENAGGLTLDPTTEEFSQIPNEPPFYTLQTTIVTPTKSVLKGTNAIFHFNNSLYLTNGGNGIKTLTVNFGTVSHTIISNGEFTPQTVNVNYTSSGTKELTCQITFNNNETLTTVGSFYFHYQTTGSSGLCSANDPRAVDDFIIAEESFQGYEANDPPIVPQVEYRTFYADASFHSDLNIYKPVIIIDGFDPGDRRKIQDCDCEEDADCASENLTNGLFNPNRHRAMEDLMRFQDGPQTRNILEDLREAGYDVLMVNHPIYETTNLNTGQTVTIDGGAYYIESNALALVALIKRVKQQLAAVNSTEEIAIVGPSMGGQISRYALAYMEKKFAETNDSDWEHNVNLWVSVDSPHLGANIPIGDQALLYMAGEMAGSESARDFYDAQLGSPAARQQLIEFHRDPIQATGPFGPFGNYQINEDNLNGRVSLQGFGSDDGSSYYTTYYNNQESNGLLNSHGYPQNLRKIALVNGSMSGRKIGYNKERVLNIRGFQEVNIDLPWPLGSINFDIHVASLESYFLSKEFTGNNKVARFKAGFDDLSHYSTNINSRGNMDIAPGGWFPAQKDIADSVMGTEPIQGANGSFWEYPEDSILYWFSNVLGGSFFSLRELKPEHSFIASFSAIAHTNPDQSWLNPLNYNLVCEGDTYFDSYFGHELNTQHTSFNSDSAAWLFDELAGNPQEPYFPISKNALDGPDFVCDNLNSTFTFNDLCKIPGQVSYWDVSQNLQTINSDGTSITVTTTNSQDNYGTIKAIFNNGFQFIKTVYMGAPNAYSLDENGNKNYMGATYTFTQQQGAYAEFSVFSDTPQTSFNFTGPSNTTWHQINNNTVEISINFTGQYTFNANATNGCGVHPYFVVVNVTDNTGGGFGNFRVMQNPVETETLTVIETDDGQTNINASETNNGSANGHNKITLELYDFNGNLIKTKKVNRNQLEKKYHLSISELSNNNYFIRIIYNEINEVYQVIIDN